MSLTVSVRIEGKKSGASGGQKSHDMREGKQPEYVDAKRSNQKGLKITTSLSSVSMIFSGGSELYATEPHILHNHGQSQRYVFS
ncbi:hypothetical protein BMR10_13995 [Methylococcaceae bacterium CS4]|nr:hypothetical protein BMR10_13995 [Methylococcaceae bacterium CS4]